MFDEQKKQAAAAAVADMCFHCGANHSNECPVAKAKEAVNNIPTEQK